MMLKRNPRKFIKVIIISHSEDGIVTCAHPRGPARRAVVGAAHSPEEILISYETLDAELALSIVLMRNRCLVLLMFGT